MRYCMQCVSIQYVKPKDVQSNMWMVEIQRTTPKLKPPIKQSHPSSKSTKQNNYLSLPILLSSGFLFAGRNTLPFTQTVFPSIKVNVIVRVVRKIIGKSGEKRNTGVETGHVSRVMAHINYILRTSYMYPFFSSIPSFSYGFNFTTNYLSWLCNSIWHSFLSSTITVYWAIYFKRFPRLYLLFSNMIG